VAQLILDPPNDGGDGLLFADETTARTRPAVPEHGPSEQTILVSAEVQQHAMRLLFGAVFVDAAF
jgi:hypothetical protein